ncbi:MAG: HAMP domain-containing histidine kinase [Atopobiaceae bacterium]|nr:HAMP domain-containing histidine kinase [Atopobiaceae bacterium]
MLRSLRIKFVAIIMVLVGAVLITVLGSSFFSTWQTQRDMTQEAIERALHGDLRQRPMIADGRSGDQQGKANLLLVAVDVSEDGMLLESNDAQAIIDSDVLADVLQEALTDFAEGNETQELHINEEVHIVWKSAYLQTGVWRVVIADTSAAYYSLSSLFVKDITITIAAMAMLLVISVGLSSWVLKPVQRAWDQQRRFVADASHELKTPLAVIIANTQILQKDSTLSDDSKRWVQSTADESAHMKNLVEELLELARTDESSAGTQGVMQKVEVDFSELVESAALEFDAIAFERGCFIDESIEAGIHVTGDPEWLGRLAKILIDNAVKYSASNKTITVKLAREGRRCTYVVNNHGQTIDPEDLEHIFDRFYRTDKARSRDAKTGGFGLGLAIAKGIATSHGGDITATSNDEDGTTFTVVLPCS